ncbi:MAG TPA: hypothetical protein VM782_23850 [Stellaceae bacterium]|nr:hypothetical protein [Stellaceae bacterium]
MMRVAFAVFLGVALATGAAVAACPTDPQPKTQQTKKHPRTDGCVNLSAVPQISAQVVAAEPAPVARGSSYTPPSAAKYEGPTLGMTKPEPGVRAVPTVGYHWNLE